MQLYFHSGTCYIINGNFELVKRRQIRPKPIGDKTLFVPLVLSQATH